MARALLVGEAADRVGDVLDPPGDQPREDERREDREHEAGGGREQQRLDERPRVRALELRGAHEEEAVVAPLARDLPRGDEAVLAVDVAPELDRLLALQLRPLRRR